jgi:hypothetical protein
MPQFIVINQIFVSEHQTVDAFRLHLPNQVRHALLIPPVPKALAIRSTGPILRPFPATAAPHRRCHRTAVEASLNPTREMRCELNPDWIHFVIAKPFVS